MIHVGDITKLNGAELPVVDCITGGSPCQDLSIAGKREGLAGERSGLFMEQIRVTREMREEDKRNGRPDHLARPRFLVWENVPGAFSSNKGEDFQAVLTEIVRVIQPEAPPMPLPEKGWPKSGCLYDDLGRWSVAWRVHDAQFWGVPQRRKRIALVADFGGLSAPEVLFERKGLSWHPEPGRETGEGTAPGTESSTPGAISFQGRLTDYTALTVGNGQLNQISMAEKANTIDTMHDQQAILWLPFGTTQITNHRNGNKPELGGPCHPLAAGAHAPSVANLDCVRRLTPLECERLQGYPDNWTDIGPWTDRKGKKQKESSDTARYKALGNSIALPFWFYLLRRISAQYERPATLGSLFDGIGGFPLCWEKCNGKGTALWASEIEEFPMAVTKARFND